MTAEDKATLEEAILYSDELVSSLSRHATDEDEAVINAFEAMEFAALQITDTVQQVIQRFCEDVGFLQQISGKLQKVRQKFYATADSDQETEFDITALRQSLDNLLRIATSADVSSFGQAASDAQTEKNRYLDASTQATIIPPQTEQCIQTDNDMFEGQVAALHLQIQNLTQEKQDLVRSFCK